jgi:hypothetical protein
MNTYPLSIGRNFPQNMPVTAITTLPPEVLIKIFSFLPAYDLAQGVKPVCRLFCDLTRNSNLCTSVNIPNYYEMDTYQAETLLNGCFHVKSIKFRNRMDAIYLMHIVLKRSPNFQSLTIEFDHTEPHNVPLCIRTELQIAPLFNQGQHLKQLTIRDMHWSKKDHLALMQLCSSSKPCLPNLEILNINFIKSEQNAILKGDSLSKILHQCPNLTEVSLTEVEDVDFGILFSGGKLQLLQKIQLYSCSFAAQTSGVTISVTNLSIDLWEGDITNEFMQQTSRNFPNLEKLSIEEQLDGCVEGDIDGSGISTFFTHCKGLQSVTIKAYFEMTNIIVLGGMLESLTHLHIWCYGYSEYKDADFELRDVDIYSLVGDCPNIKILKLSSPKLTHIGMWKIFQSCTNLEELTLHNFSQEDITPGFSLPTLSTLKYLKLKGHELSNSALRMFATGCPALLKLVISTCSKVNIEGIITSFFNNFSHPDLREVKLHGNFGGYSPSLVKQLLRDTLHLDKLTLPKDWFIGPCNEMPELSLVHVDGNAYIYKAEMLTRVDEGGICIHLTKHYY